MKEELKEKRGKITPHTSHNSGITLIALIITIIVLLILAVVAIRAVQGDGIISYAKNATDAYSEKQEEEENTIDSYINTLLENDLNKKKIYTLEEINNSDNLWAIGTNTDRTNVIAVYKENTQTLEIVKNSNDSDGVMMDFTSNTSIRNWGKTIKKVEIKEGIKNISDYAFYYMTSLEEVYLPETLESIGKCAFAGIKSLEIDIPNNVTEIKNLALGANNITFGDKFNLNGEGISFRAFEDNDKIFSEFGNGIEEVVSKGLGGSTFVFYCEYVTINGHTRQMTKKLKEVYGPIDWF